MRALLFGRRPERIEFARSLGIESLDTRDAPVAEAVRERTEGRGADAAIECTGTVEMWESAPALVRRGGRVSFFAGLPGDARVSFLAARLHYDEVRAASRRSTSRPRDVRAAYELIAARELPLTRLISGTYPLAEIATAFARLDAGDGMKVLIQP